MIKVGCCGFPINREEYFKRFKLVEIQNTFYQPPTLNTIKRLREKAPTDLEFSIKAWQIITHPYKSSTYRRLKERIGDPKNYGDFKYTEEVFSAWRRTREIAEILDAKVILFQTPNSFKPTDENIDNLRNFFDAIDRSFIYAWEPRGGWSLDIIESLCRELDLIHCVDPFHSRAVFGSINYFRLHGKPFYNLRYKYSDDDLRHLLNLCDKEENYVLFNNLSMVDDAIRLQNLIIKL